MVNEVIQIVTTMVDNVTGQATKIQKSIQSMNGRILEQTNAIRTNNQGLETYNVTTEKVTKGLHKFQMQWLSLLFFGMSMQRLFNGLIKTSLEWVGITELMSTTLGVLFLPVAETLLEFLLPIMEWFMELPESMKKALGWFVVGGIILGGFLSTIGQLALGFAGLQWGAAILGLGNVGTAANIAKTKLLTFSSILSGLLAAVAIGITIYFIIKELQKGQITAAIGAATAGIGFLTGNPFLIGLGITFLIIGDKDLQVGLAKIAIQLIDFALSVGEKIGEIIVAAFTPGKKIKDIDLGTLNVFGSFDVAGIELMNEDKIKSNLLKSLPSFNVMNEETFNKVYGVKDAIISPSGRVITTDPRDYLIATTNPQGLGSSGNVSVVYNVTVSDKKEFEEMLRRNTDNMTREVRRLTS